MRENVIRFVAAGILATTQPVLAKTKCEGSLARKTRSPAKTAVAAANTPDQVNANVLLQKLTSQVQLSRKANDLGFDFNQAPTRSITRAEAMPIVSMMVRLQQFDADKVANDIANIQLYGHFDKLNDIGTVLASAYASKMNPKNFANSLALIQQHIRVPNTSELGYNAASLRKPEITEAMMVFNLLVANKGDGDATQRELVEVAEALDTGDLTVVIAVIEEATIKKIAPTEMAQVVSQFASSVQLQKRVIGFGPQSEVVTPTALEAVQLLHLASQLKMSVNQLAKTVQEIAAQTDATDFASIIATLSESLQPNQTPDT